jgi:farnesyl diphosphate synthase
MGIAPAMSVSMSEDFQAALAASAAAVERLLDALLSQRPEPGEIVRPANLLAAMRHGVLNGGKRLRPFLLIESAALFGAADPAALRAAAALECVHCYSLIHDDLPAMDDDDLRRGQPTVHRAFDEATAILAGDSLLTLAFDILASTELPPAVATELVLGLARAAGIGGMAGGQALDLAAEREAPDEEDIVSLQAMKTGALIRFACEAGAILGGASPDERARLAEFGSAIGLAFQLADDLLDLTASSDAVGKATGKDAAAGKATLAALHGVEWARRQLDGLVGQAELLLEPWGDAAAMLREAARFVAARTM